MTDRHDFRAFVSLVAARLKAGEREYQDRSFARPSAELAGEIEEELLDVCAWSFILWCRLRRLHDAVGLAECGLQPVAGQEKHDQHAEAGVDDRRADREALGVPRRQLLDVQQVVEQPPHADDTPATGVRKRERR